MIENNSMGFEDFSKIILDSVLEGCFCSDLGYISLLMNGYKDDSQEDRLL